MKHISVLVLTLTMLTGCAFTHMSKGLEALNGRNVEIAFSVLGYPDLKQEFGGDTVYTWNRNRSGTLFLPQTSTTTGKIGAKMVSCTTTQNQAVPVNYNCTIKIATDNDGVIKHWEWSGNQAGCAPYAKKLRKYYKSLEE